MALILNERVNYMRYVADHDFHIHSTISPCCSDENQIPENLLKYAKVNGLKKICLTNHFWDETVESVDKWHPDEYFPKVSSVLPLPQDPDVEFLFGIEGDMDYNFVLGINPDKYDVFDFMVISTTHLQVVGYTVKEEITDPQVAADLWFKRLYKLLEMDLPWHKVGIAHLTTGHIYEYGHLEVIKLFPEDELYKLFTICAQKGVGIELNIKTLGLDKDEKEILLKPFRIAKECGCKFYLGSDSHSQSALKNVKANFEDVITELDLKECHKMQFCKEKHK